MKSRTRWTFEEEDTLIRLAGTMPVQEVADKVGRSLPACVNRAYALDISLAYKHSFKRWTQRDKDKLQQLWEDGYSWKVIAQVLERQEPSVRGAIAHNLGPSPKRWMNHEKKFLIQNYHRMKRRAIADYLGRTYSAIRNYADKLIAKGEL